MKPLIEEVEKSRHELIFVHTGQHYDFMMSGNFIKELQVIQPDYFLNVKSRDQGVQTGQIIAKCENVLKDRKPDIVLVEGDTNSALGAAIASSKLALPVGHVEAGCRSFDKSMPEEINRVLISDIANLHFAPTSNCVDNLRREGVALDQIFMTGHPIVDLIKQVRNKITGDSLRNLNTSNKGFALVTLHRRENIGNRDKISAILTALHNLAKNTKLIFPCHPHTKSQISRFALQVYLKNIKVISPVGYLDSLSLIKHARFVLTDSGGIQQEAAILGTPCITLRQVTEWVETVNAGVNYLAGHSSKSIAKTVGHIETNYEDIVRRLNSVGRIFGKAGASRRILHIIEQNCSG